MHDLISSLNVPESDFKTRGFNYDNNAVLDLRKFSLSVIITADTPWTSQAHELAEAEYHSTTSVPKESKVMRNPKGNVYFPGDEIDLHKVRKPKEGNVAHANTFFEFVGAKFSDRSERSHTGKAQRPDILGYDGLFFMSGSKKTKFGDAVDAVNQKVRNLRQ